MDSVLAESTVFSLFESLRTIWVVLYSYITCCVCAPARRMREKFETEMGELEKSERQATHRLTELKARSTAEHVHSIQPLLPVHSTQAEAAHCHYSHARRTTLYSVESANLLILACIRARALKHTISRSKRNSNKNKWSSALRVRSQAAVLESQGESERLKVLNRQKEREVDDIRQVRERLLTRSRSRRTHTHTPSWALSRSSLPLPLLALDLRISSVIYQTHSNACFSTPFHQPKRNFLYADVHNYIREYSFSCKFICTVLSTLVQYACTVQCTVVHYVRIMTNVTTVIYFMYNSPIIF